MTKKYISVVIPEEFFYIILFSYTKKFLFFSCPKEKKISKIIYFMYLWEVYLTKFLRKLNQIVLWTEWCFLPIEVIN